MRKTIGLKLLFYIIAALFLVYTLCVCWNCHEYVSSLIAQQQFTVKGNVFAVVNYYMTNAGNYLVYALILFGFGWMFPLSSKDVPKKADTVPPLLEAEEIETKEEPLEGFSLVDGEHETP